MSSAIAPALRDLASEAPVLCATLGASAALGVYAALPLRLPFSAHPILMMLAFATVSSAAIAAKQQRAGRRNTLTHAYAMVIAASLAIGGWYSIWRQKELLGKPHNTSWHSLTGLAVLCYFIVGCVCTLLLLHPDFGCATKSVGVRRVHRVTAALASTLAFATVVTGWAKLASPASTAALIALFAGLGWRLRLLSSALGQGTRPEYFSLPLSPPIGR